MRKLLFLLTCLTFGLTANIRAQAFDCPYVVFRNNGNNANQIPSAYYYTNPSVVIPPAKTGNTNNIQGEITLKFSTNPTVVPFITGVFVGTTTYTCVVGPPSTVSTSGNDWLIKYCVYFTNLPPNNSSFSLQFSNPNSTTVTNVTGPGSFLKICSYGSGNSGSLIAAPVISAQPANVSGCQNQTVTFSVSAAAQNGGTLSYQWRKNGIALTNGGSISGATSTTLSIANTALLDAGNYDVLIAETTTSSATTGAFTISSAGTLVIYETFNAGSIATTGETICYNGNPSTINNAAVATGGNLNYSYQWQESSNNGVSFTDISGATSSSYTPPNGLTQTKIFRRTAMDGRCQTTFTPSTGTWKVTVPTAPISATSAKTSYNGSDLSCSNATDGQITVTASGSYGNYQYSNDNGSNWQISNVFSSLAAGSYTILVKDNNNCQTSTSKTLTAPSQVAITATATQILCYGGTGSVALTSNGGTGTLTYGTTATTSLTADTYNYTVTDANGCSANTDAVINAAPSQVTITATATQILCYGGTGSVALTSNGGTGTLTYGTTATTSLTADTYNYTVTDANGCSANTSAVINAAPALLVVTPTATNVTCFGLGNGSISLNVTGGVTAYTYLWSNAATTAGISNLTPGTYSVTVKDANNCTATGSTSISQPALLTLTLTKVNPTGYACLDGSITGNANGGNIPYSFKLGSGIPQGSSSFSGLAAGSYSLLVSDAKGCTASASGAIAPIPCQGFVSYSQGGWGGGNTTTGNYLNSFTSVFPSSIIIGSGTRKLVFTSKSGVQGFLPSGSTARALNVGTLTNPTRTGYANVFAGQVLALTLSAAYDDALPSFAPASGKLRNLVIGSGAFAGITVSQLLAFSNTALGGGTTPYTISQLNTAVAAVNLTYDGSNSGYLFCPCALSKKGDEEQNTLVLDNVSKDLSMNCYPNPFTDDLQVQFTTVGAGKTTVELLDLSGKQVAVLFDAETMESSTYSATFKGSEYVSGVYFCRMQSGDQVVIRKVILTR